MATSLIDLKVGDKLTITKGGKPYNCTLKASKFNDAYFKAIATGEGKEEFYLATTIDEAKLPKTTDPVDGEIWSTEVAPVK